MRPDPQNIGAAQVKTPAILPVVARGEYLAGGAAFTHAELTRETDWTIGPILPELDLRSPWPQSLATQAPACASCGERAQRTGSERGSRATKPQVRKREFVDAHLNSCL